MELTLQEMIGYAITKGSAMNSNKLNRNGYFAPSVCPITLRKFFAFVEHPELGIVPTYGGPYDSYTIPEPGEADGNRRFDVQYECQRFDHDLGGWVDGVEICSERVVHEETLIDLGAWPDEQ